jgi:cytochrome c2
MFNPRLRATRPAAKAFTLVIALGGSVGCSSSSSKAPDGGSGNPNAPLLGDATRGKDVFRFETFGNEGFWTDAARLPEGLVAAKFTPVMALKAGLSVDSEALIATFPSATVTAVIAELATDLSPAKAPLLNDPATTVALINANAVIGLSVKDTDMNGKLDVAAGDKVGVTCAFCHSITDKSVFDLPTGGSIGKRVDGPAVHTVNVGAAFALAANSRALFPMLQLKGADGKTIGRDPSFAGLTKDSTEAEVDAYLTNPMLYPIGMFDDTVDGNGNPMHNTPMFRADLAAPWGSAGEFSKLDQFANTVYTVLLDPTNLTTTAGKAFLHKVGAAGGDALAADYTAVLAATGVTGYPYVKGSTVTSAGDADGPVGIRVDNQKLLDMNAYLSALPAPKGVVTDATAVASGRAAFVATANQCTQCHNVDQSVMVLPTIIETSVIFPGDMPVVIAARDAPLSPIENTAGNTFDDKMIVINASIRGLKRGSALPLLLDLARKPVFLHDNSVATLEELFDPARGAMAPHPFYLTDAAARTQMAAFLKSLDAGN